MDLPAFTKTQQGDKGKAVKLVQEWLNLHDCGTGIDSDFGPATERSVQDFQGKKRLPKTGVVDRKTFDALLAPMAAALAPINSSRRSIGQLIVAYARQHLRQHPREVGGDNRGPWVRLYMNGKDGPSWYWCAGFATNIIGQAADAAGVSPYMSYQVSCDRIAQLAQRDVIFLSKPSADDRKKIRPGALFLYRAKPNDWTHTGLVTGVHDDTFATIEGNTNDDGNRNGYEVCKRNRRFSSKYDFVLV